MAKLTGQTIADSYDQLLIVDDANGISASLQAVESADTGGSSSALKIATNKIEIIPGSDDANAFEVSNAAGTAILTINSSTPSVLVSGSGTKLYLSDAGGEYISGDGSHLTITSGGDIRLACDTVGIEVTPEAWHADHTVLQLGGTGAFFSPAAQVASKSLHINQNSYVTTGGTESYIITDEASEYYQQSGTHVFNVAASGSADAGITWTTPFKLDINSRISLSNNDSGGTGGEDSTSGNTLFGYLTGAAIASGGTDNTAIGHKALNANTTGDDNIAIGVDALGTLNAATAVKNIAIGNYALDATSTNLAEENVAIGHGAGGGITSGDRNTIIGSWAGEAASTVTDAVLIGNEAGKSIMTSDAIGTVAVGGDALAALTSGIGNVAIGYQSLDANQTSDYNTAVGHQALSAVNGDGTGGNTAVGRLAGATLTSGTANTAVGHVALYQDDDGSSSVAVGSHALFTQNIANAASGNTGVGTESGYFNVTGTNNTYVGYHAGKGATGYSNSGNTGIGKDALLLIEGGASNTCVGVGAGDNITRASYNVCIGSDAGAGIDSVNADANYNTLVGSLAGQSFDRANGTFFGYNSGTNQVSGQQVCYIGAGTVSGGTNNDHETCIGNGAPGQGSNCLSLGSTNINTLYSQQTSITGYTSDERTKENIEDLDMKGLEFINELKMKKFNWINPADYPDDIRDRRYDEGHEHWRPRPSDNTVKDIGMIAQDVIETMESLDMDMQEKISPIRDPAWGASDTIRTITYGNLIFPLIKAVQELSAKVKALEDAQ